MLERLCASIDHAHFRESLGKAFVKWMAAIEELAVEAGVQRSTARARAEDAVVRIEVRSSSRALAIRSHFGAPSNGSANPCLSQDADH